MFDDIFFWAQVIGVCGLCVNILTWQLKSAKNIILISVPAYILWSMQYIMIDAPLGAITNICSALRNCGLAFIKDRFVPYCIMASIAFIWVVGLYFYNTWYDILPLLSGTLINLGLIFRDNRALLARTTIIYCMLGLIYDVIVGSYIGFICGVFIIVSAVIGMYRHENWKLGNCYKSFIPNATRSLFAMPSFRTFP